MMSTRGRLLTSETLSASSAPILSAIPPKSMRIMVCICTRCMLHMSCIIHALSLSQSRALNASGSSSRRVSWRRRPWRPQASNGRHDLKARAPALPAVRILCSAPSARLTMRLTDTIDAESLRDAHRFSPRVCKGERVQNKTGLRTSLNSKP